MRLSVTFSKIVVRSKDILFVGVMNLQLIQRNNGCDIVIVLILRLLFFRRIDGPAMADEKRDWRIQGKTDWTGLAS